MRHTGIVDRGAWLFAYGSLVAPAEARRTLGVAPEARPATVHGLARGWWVGTAGRSYRCGRCGRRQAVAVVLGCLPLDGARTAGVLLRVDSRGRRLLDRREASYAPLALDPRAVEAHGGTPRGAPVMTYTPLPDRLRDAHRPGAAVPAVYERTVEDAFAAAWRHAGDGRAAFRATTAASDLPRRADLTYAGPDPDRGAPPCACPGP